MDELGGELWAGNAEAWEADANHHLNVRFFLAKHQEAVGSLAAEIGMPRAFSADAEATVVVRDQYVRFLREARSPDSLVMTGGIVALDETTARLMIVMRHLRGEVAAIFHTVVEHVTAREMRPFPWPARVRERAEAWMIAVPDGMGSRSLHFDPVEPQASRARADELGLGRGAYGLVTPQDCDVFGRLRTEMVIARISQGIHRVSQGQPTGAHGRDGRDGASKIGGAALEYRLVYLAWPQAGDRMEVRGGLAWNDSRFRRVVNWVVDPETGRPWATTEVLLTTFDMEARKMITFTPDQQAAIAAHQVPGLTL